MRRMLLGNSKNFASGVVSGTIPNVDNFDGAWFYKEPPTLTGVVVDERRGLGTDRDPLPLRALDLNGTNQYGHITVDQVEYPFSLFGWADTDTDAYGGLLSVSDPSNSARYLSLYIDDGNRIYLERRNTSSVINEQSVPLVTGWFSVVVVFQDATTVSIYRNGALLHTFSGLTPVSADVGFTRFAFGTYRTASPGTYWNGRVMNCGFLRRAATLADAQEFHETGIIPDAEVLLPLDNNSTTVSYNIGRSASWWVNEPRRNLESYPQDLTNAVWRKSAVSPTTTKIVETATTAEHRIDNLTQFAVVAGETWSLSFSAKAAERTRIRAGFDSLGILNARGFFDLSNGTADNTIAGSTYTITPDTDLGSGWYRCTVTSTAIGSGNVRIEINLVSGTGSLATTVSYLGDIANGAFVTNIQRERGVATTFQPVSGTGTEQPEATLVNAPTSYVGRDVPFSRQNQIGYSTRRNLYLLTEEFDNAYWTKTNATITANNSISPLGSLTADSLLETVASSQHNITRILSPTLTAGSVYTLSIYAKSINGRHLQMVIGSDLVSSGYANFDLTNGVVGSLSAGVTSSIESMDNGWYRCLATFTAANASGGPINFQTITTPSAARSESIAGDITKGLVLFGAQIALGSTGEYQRIGADPGTTVLFPALLDDPTKSAARDTLEFSGEAHMNGQLEDANCFTFDGVDDYVAMNLGDVAGTELVTNGTFDSNASGWAATSSGVVTWNSGRLNIQRVVDASDRANQSISTVAGKTYLISIGYAATASGIGSPTLRVGTSAAGATVLTTTTVSTGTKLIFVALGATSHVSVSGSGTGVFAFDDISIKELPTITHDGTSTLTYRSQADGFTGTAGTAYNIRFGDVETIPCSEGGGQLLGGSKLNQQYQVVNGQASNWTTNQDTYHANTVLGHSQQSGDAIETDDEKIAALFASGEVGCVFDPYDIDTLFQDHTGQTPVTDFGQNVGLHLDKSKGLVLGPELVTNGDFSNGFTNWSSEFGAGFSEVGGRASITNASTNIGLMQTGLTLNLNKTYLIEYDLNITSGGIVNIRFGGDSSLSNIPSAATSTSGRKSIVAKPLVSTDRILLQSSTGSTLTIDNISVRELPGNHRYQSTSGSRPIYARKPATGRRNLLIATELLSSASWTATSVTCTASGGLFKLVGDNAATVTFLRQNYTVAQNGQVVVTSCFAKEDDARYMHLGRAGVGVWFDLRTGTALFASAGFTSSVGDLQPDGTRRYAAIVTETLSNGTATNVRIYPSVDAPASALPTTGGNDGTKGILINYAQFEVISLTNYQKVVSSHDVTEEGVEEVRYLQYATSRWMETNAIDFSGTDATTVVWAGRKNTDASPGVIVESSPSMTLNNGTIRLLAPQTVATGDYSYSSKGTSQSTAISTTAYVAPISNVLSGISDISLDIATLRVNGGAATFTSTADQGSGNQGNHKLYFGARGGTSLWGNHEENFIFIRGASTPVFNLEQIENIAASKLGIADFHLEDMIRIPASLTNPGFDVLGNQLTNPPKVGLNDSESTVNHSPVANSWPDTYSIPGADLSNYEFDGAPGDIDILIDRQKHEGKFRLENQ